MIAISPKNYSFVLSRKKYETSDERRSAKRVAQLSKQNERREARVVKYGSDSVGTVAADFNKRFVAAFMALVFALSCLVLGVNFATRAASESSDLQPGGTDGVADTASGLVLNKYLSSNSNGKYDLTLEAYSTSQVQQITEKVPTDFVVVVDQSGSMSTSDMPTGTATVRNNVNLETVADGAYYYYDSQNKQYYRVYGVKDYLYRYYEPNTWYVGDILDRVGADLSWFQGSEEQSFSFANQFYFRDNGTYYPIKLTIAGKLGTYYNKFEYTDSNQNPVQFLRQDKTYTSQAPIYKNVLGSGKITPGWKWGLGLVLNYDNVDSAVRAVYSDEAAYTYSEVLNGAISTGMYVNYPMYDRKVGYIKLCYRDINGVEHELPSDQNSGQTTWEFCNSSGQAITTNSGSTRPTYSGLYTFSGTTTRLAALKVALNQFAQAVADETDSFGSVDNKISIMGFSSSGYNNTELLTGDNVTISGTNGVQKSVADKNVDTYYGTALVDSTDGNVGTINSKITDAITALTASGGTQPEDGLDMAYKVLTKRDTETYTIRSGSKKGTSVKRNMIVIFFTDGQPGNYHYSDQYAEANDVVESALPIKQYGASLFSIGVFGESDGNPLTYDAGNEYTTDPSTGTSVKISSLSSRYWQYLDGWVESYPESNPQYCLKREWRSGKDGYTSTANDTIFDYMSVTSSNYPDAEDFIAPTWISGTYSGTYTTATEDVRSASTKESTNKYYRMASNQDTLVAAFLQAVSMNNTEYQSTVSLDTTAILRDVLSSDFSITTGESEASQNTSVTCETVVGTMDPTTGDVTFSTASADRVDITPSPAPSFSNGVLDYSGFDFTGNAIPNNGVAGKKLVVTITNIYPTGSVTSTDGPIYSNDDTSGIYSVDATENTEELVAAFPMPSISRHSYTLDVGSANTNDVFTVATELTTGTSSLDDVILVKPDGTRIQYSSAQTFSNVGDTDVFYYENVPDDYSVKTSVTATDTAYTYTMYANSDSSNTSELSTSTATDRTLTYADSVLHITSVANNYTVTIEEDVSGPYSNTDNTFSPTLILIPPSGTTVSDGDTLTLATGVTLTGDATNNYYTGTVSNIQGNGSTGAVTLSIPAGYTLKVSQDNSGTYYESPSISYSKSDGNSISYTDSGIVIDDTTSLIISNASKNSIAPETGITENGNRLSIFMYILAGICAICAVVAFVYTKKRRA